MSRCKNDPILKAAIFILVAFWALGFSSNAQAGGVNVDFKQASNKNPTQGEVVWIGSILQGGNSTYYEGMSSLQRLVLVGIPKTPGDVHTLTLKHQASKGGIHAYDFLTSWPQGLQAADEIGGPTMFVNLNECGPNIGPPTDLGAICSTLHSGGFTVTPDAPVPGIVPSFSGDDVPTVVANYEAHFGNRTVKIYANAPISASSVTFDGYSGSGDVNAEYTISWTSSSDSIIIELAGHLAVGIDPLGAGIGYGQGLGSANISGGPYHFGLSHLDGNSLGSQDNQIKGADILLPPPVCDVTPVSQEACLGASAVFTDNTSGGTPPFTYCWKKEPYTGDCLSITDELTISGAILDDAGEYRVVVTGATGLSDTCYAELLVHPRPECDVTSDHDSICAGFDASFTASGSGGTLPYTYNWTGPAGFTANTATINIANGQLINTGTYQVIVADANGCADTCFAELIVYAPPECDLTPDRDSIRAGSDASFTASGSGGTPPYTFDWTGPGGFTAISATINITNAQLGDAGTYQVIVTDAHDCADTCSAELIVYPDVIIIVPEDDSVHAGDYFVSTDFSVSSGTKAVVVSICGITPPPTHQPTIVENHVEWQTECADDGKIFTICLEAVNDFGAKDTGYFDVTVYNRPPELTCPDDGIVPATETFVSTDFSVTDPDGDPAPVTFLDINPPASNDPELVGSHVEWVTTVAEWGQDHIIRLVAADHCGLADTCEFMVTVDQPTGEFECPDDDTVLAGENHVSTYFTVTYPECPLSSVVFLGITPSATNDPIVVGDHVEWATTCAEDGDYVIRLRTDESCSVQDTCEYTVTVYNLPPQLTCPDYGTVYPKDLFISTDFHVQNGDINSVVILGIDPPAEPEPVIVEHHVEWLTLCLPGDYVIQLEATGRCGLKDTCEFAVSVTFENMPNFYVWAYPTLQYVAAGQAAGYLVELNSMNGFASPCSLLVSGFPDPPGNAVFDQMVLVPTDTTTLSVYTTSLTPLGSYTLLITGKEISGPVQHTILAYLNVQEPSDVRDEADYSNLPRSFTLFQNQPNPFNPETQISYYLPKDCQVKLTIYNVLGRRVKTLFDGHEDVGMHTLIWDGRADGGSLLSSGIYFYRLQADTFEETRKMTLMK